MKLWFLLQYSLIDLILREGGWYEQAPILGILPILGF